MEVGQSCLNLLLWICKIHAFVSAKKQYCVSTQTDSDLLLLARL